jgi:hypothetical protein
MKNAVFCDMTSCGSWMPLRSVLQLLVTANVVPSSLSLITLMI